MRKPTAREWRRFQRARYVTWPKLLEVVAGYLFLGWAMYCCGRCGQ